jgi:hypothetical protein
LLCTLRPAGAFGILTHEAIINASWEPVILPALKKRFPATPADSLKACITYTYGGAIMPDMGYFPGGSRLFSDIMHYVRTGDFVKALSDSAADVREYAFALGALAHYTADRYGHPLGVNPSVSLLFPDLRARYGNSVSYVEDPKAHARTEFGFDVLQTARGNYDVNAYRQFVDFRIAHSLLTRVFRATYSMEIDSLFKNFDRSARSFRWAIKEVLPQVTRQAWRSKSSEIRKLQPTAAERRFRYSMSRADFTTAYGTQFDRPGFRAHLIAFVLQALPKVGPLKILKPVIPTPEAEILFIKSFDIVTAQYRRLVFARGETLADVNYDTGEPAHAGKYAPADEAYTACLMHAYKRDWVDIRPDLKSTLVRYFKNMPPDDKRSEELETALYSLRNL